MVCPVTSIAANGKHTFYGIDKCGCVVSERAIKGAALFVRVFLIAFYVLLWLAELQESEGSQTCLACSRACEEEG